jgi:tetratricopeptide (TPR) repeat protein
LFSSSGRAAEPLGGPSLSAEDLVQEALGAESDGRSRDFARWSREALAQAPALPAARWLAGQVLVQGDWVKADEAPKVLASDKNYQEYLRVRAKYADTARDQFRLGQWCAQRRLTEQARAHFARVVQLDPNNAAAWAQLGYKRVGETWCSPADIERLKHLKSDYAYWKAKLETIRNGLGAGDSGRREQAGKELAAITSPAAVLAMETVLAPAGESQALLTVEAVGKISGPEASLSLARLATFCPYWRARYEAIGLLKSRPWGEFMPAMLDAMPAPVINFSAHLSLRNDGTAILEQKLTREHHEVIQELTIKTKYWAPDGGPFGLGVLGTVDFFPSVYQAWWTRQRQAEDNLRAEQQVIAPIAAVLNEVTDQQLASEAKVWWDWWDNYNEIHYGEKPVVRTYRWETRVANPYPILHACFAAGTPVWTIDGPRPIERVTVGDLVLAQHPTTGELAYKPVVQTTVAPPADLVIVVAGEDRLVCTPGHRFWVPGRGWVHASKLDASVPLHKVGGATAVSQVGRGPKEKAYNLVVADFNTYFVGKEKLLVHDVTLPAPTTADVPGQKTP